MPKTFLLSSEERKIAARIRDLKGNSGSHSPSVSMLKKAIPEVKFKIDACFLSNPYATDLFMSYFQKNVLETGELRSLLEFYPAQNAEIAQGLGKTIGISPKNLFIANGASEVIYAVMRNFSGKKLAVILPTFSPYYEFAQPNQEIVYYQLKKENNFELDPADYLEFIKREDPDTLILINPNNPNGSYITTKAIESIIKSVPATKTIIIDESFIHFAFEDPEYKPVSVAKLISKFPNLIVVKSMSKDFGIAGVRAGYGVMSKKRINSLISRGYLWNSNGLAEYFFHLYEDRDFLQKYEVIRKKHIAETQNFINQLSKIPNLKSYPSFGNFVLAELPDGYGAEEVTIAMLSRYGIYVRDCSDKMGLKGNFIRIASRTKKENEEMLKAFSEILS